MTVFEGEPRGNGLRICLVVSRFNAAVTERLEDGARKCLLERGVREEDIEIVRVPGAWELPMGARLAISRGQYDGVVALGCVIRGETPHFEYVSLGATVGLEAVGRDSGVPLGFGVLTTDTGEQAFRRAGGGKGNKGEEAALATLEMCDLASRMR